MPQVLLLLLLVVPAAAQTLGVRVVLGLTDKVATTWDGSVSVERGRVGSIEGWRFEGEDSVNGASWRAATRPIRLFGGARARDRRPSSPTASSSGWPRPRRTRNCASRPRRASSRWAWRKFLSEIGAPFGRPRDGGPRAPAARLTTTPDEQDYPAAAADKNGNLWLAYLEFKHHPEHDRIRANFRDARPSSTI